jgi:hypothetical protein
MIAREVAGVSAVAVHHPDVVVLVDAVPGVAVGDQAAVGREARVELWPPGRGEAPNMGAVDTSEETSWKSGALYAIVPSALGGAG